MADKYLNDTGLQYFYNKLKTVFQAKETGKGLSTNDYTTTEKTKLSGIATGAEVNQNAFSNIKVGSTTIGADSKTDTLELIAGSNITLTPNATADAVSISANSSVESANKLTTARYIDGKQFDGSADLYRYYRATGSGNTISVSNSGESSTSLKYENGTTVVVYFANNISTGNKTLNVNDLGAWPIISNGLNFASAIKNHSVYTFVLTESPSSTSSNPAYVWNMLSGLPASMTQDDIYYARTEPMLVSASFLSTAIANAISGITGISFEVVQQLPTTGTAGVIYLVAHSHGTRDIYDEYIWVNSTYEKIGSTDIDLSGYMLKTDMIAITTSEIDSLFV